MSRLDSMIRRLTAQRDILNQVAQAGSLPAEGAILELGLGNGRTYSHLRELFPDRRIVVFDRAMNAHSSSAPPPEDFEEGEIDATAAAYRGGNAALVHADIGQGYADRDAETLAWLPGLVAECLAPGGVAISGLPLDHPELDPEPIPDGIAPGRYFHYRRRTSA